MPRTVAEPPPPALPQSMRTSTTRTSTRSSRSGLSGTSTRASSTVRAWRPPSPARPQPPRPPPAPAPASHLLRQAVRAHRREGARAPRRAHRGPHGRRRRPERCRGGGRPGRCRGGGGKRRGRCVERRRRREGVMERATRARPEAATASAGPAGGFREQRRQPARVVFRVACQQEYFPELTAVATANGFGPAGGWRRLIAQRVVS